MCRSFLPDGKNKEMSRRAGWILIDREFSRYESVIRRTRAYSRTKGFFAVVKRTKAAHGISS